MKLIIVRNKKEGAKKAAEIIAQVVKKKPNAVLELATGVTMVPLYKKLVKIYRKGEIDFSKITTFNLDEYAHVPYNHPESYHYYMNKNLFDKVNIQKINTHFPSSNGKEYENEIKKAGGADLSILGVGVNGHIAFNEPGSSFNSKTREVKLSKETIKSNSVLFPGKKVPKEAYTVGINTIMKSKKVILLAFGKKKAEAIFDAVERPVTEETPASVLRKHKEAVFIIDKKAAIKLSKKN
jgi:glucosamine-6-phosphate deaminase